MSKTDDIAINNPFKIAGDLVGMINVNLCTAINRAVNSLNFSKEELQGILSLLEEREGKIATVYNNLLTGIITDFNLQLDSGKRFLTGHDLFWIEAGRYKAEAMHSPKKSAIDDTTEKLNMLKTILSMKTLLNKRTYDEASRGILAEIRLSEKEYANSFYADYIDFEQLYYSFLRDLATVRMQATLIAAVMEWRKTGSVPTAVSTLSEAEKIPVQMTINPFSGKPFQIASESIGDSGAGAKKAIVIQGIKEWKEFHGAIKAIYVMGNE